MKYFAALALLISLASVSGTTSTIPIITLPTITIPTVTLPTITLPTITIPTITHKPGSTGDPIMTGLDGRSFEFFGKAGLIYNVLSEKRHQISMKLKEGKMWDHEGTYMASVGFRYLDHTVEVMEEADGLAVTLDGDRLVMRPSQSEQEVILGLAEGEMSLLWQLHRADFGNTVELTTDLLKLVCWVTPAGTRDEGGKVQPAYLNFDLTLHASPAGNHLEGIIGETFAAAASSAPAADDFAFHGVEADYEMASLFETAHPKSIFGKAHAGKARKLIEAVQLPLRASSIGVQRDPRAASQGLRTSRKALQ